MAKGLIGGLGETDSWKKPEVAKSVTLFLQVTVYYFRQKSGCRIPFIPVTSGKF
jgi:hypothetical protein